MQYTGKEKNSNNDCEHAMTPPKNMMRSVRMSNSDVKASAMKILR